MESQFIEHQSSQFSNGRWRRFVVQKVDMALEIEPRLHGRTTDQILTHNFIQRLLVFTLSGSCIVDLKS